MNRKKKLSGWENKKRAEKFQSQNKEQAKLWDKWLEKTKPTSNSVNFPGERNIEENIVEINFEHEVTQPFSQEINENLEDTEDIHIINEALNSIDHDKSVIEDENEKEKKIDFNNPISWSLNSDKYRCLLVSHGPEHRELEKYPCSTDDAHDRGRSFNNSWMYKTLNNNEKNIRKWLFYSEEMNALYCFPCLLFSKTHSSLFSQQNCGFSKWKHLNPRIPNHESSLDHINSYTSWKIFERNLKASNTIDDNFQTAIKNEIQKWRHILKVILRCVLFCAKNNLALRGSKENLIDGNLSRGIFLNLIDLVSNYDRTIKQFLENRTKGQINYLSPDIQNEFIQLLSSKVKTKILEEIKEAKYYSIIIDATPDLSHNEQLCQIIRYVKICGENVYIEERFIDFICSKNKHGEGIANEILEKLTFDGLNVNNIRGQGYDNGSNMAGKFKGVQAHIMRKNSLAKYVPCATHSLNLVGVHAASNNVEIISFFGIVQKLYNFFALSTRRWDKISSVLNIALKSHSDTRWSSKANAVSALYKQIKDVIDVLSEISEDISYGDGVATARTLKDHIERYNFIFMLIMWNNILIKINTINTALQKRTVDISRSSQMLVGLLNDFKQMRIDDNYDLNKITNETVRICEEIGINSFPQNKRKRIRKRQAGENAADESYEITDKDKLKYLYFNVLDVIINQLTDRFDSMKHISTLFAFLSGEKLESESLTDLNKAVKNLCLEYAELDCTQMLNEIECFKFQSKELFKNLNSLHHFEILKEMVKFDLCETFPNIFVALRILLTLPVTVASGERSFSKLKIIKNYLRSVMKQNRLSGMTILSIECDLFEETNFDDIIDEFASMKARKIKLK